MKPLRTAVRLSITYGPVPEGDYSYMYTKANTADLTGACLHNAITSRLQAARNQGEKKKKARNA